MSHSCHKANEPTSSDHGLTHLLILLVGRHSGRSGVGVKDNLGAGILPHLTVGHHGQDLHRVDVGLAVVLCDLLLRVPERLLDGVYLGVPVHVQFVNIHLLPDGVANVSFHLLDGGWLIPKKMYLLYQMVLNFILPYLVFLGLLNIIIFM